MIEILDRYEWNNDFRTEDTQGYSHVVEIDDPLFLAHEVEAYLRWHRIQVRHVPVK